MAGWGCRSISTMMNSQLVRNGSLTCGAVAWFLFGLNVAAGQTCPSPKLWDFYDREVASREYNLRLEVDRIARMPDAQRATQIPHVYRDIFADLHKRWYALDNWMMPLVTSLDGYRESKTPAQGIKFGAIAGYPNMIAQQISLLLFVAYPQQTQPLILQDLRSADSEAISRGLYVAGWMQEAVLPGLFDDLQRISLSDGQCSDEALRTLVDYSLRPTAPFQLPDRGKTFTPSSKALGLIPLLVPKFQKQPERYAWVLRDLLRYAPAPESLLADLDSKDVIPRQQALYALEQNQYLPTTSYILKLAADRDPKLRAWSIRLGFQKRRPDFSHIKPALAKLMNDPESDIRRSATEQFAGRGDPICAASLLRLLREAYEKGSGDFFQLAASADYIAHQKFGFDSGTERVPMRNERNEAALKRYARWVRSRQE